MGLLACPLCDCALTKCLRGCFYPVLPNLFPSPCWPNPRFLFWVFFRLSGSKSGGESPLALLRDNGCLFCRGRRNVTCVPDVNTSTTLGRLPRPGLHTRHGRMRYLRGPVRAGTRPASTGEKPPAASADGKTVPSTTARSGGSASVLWGLAHFYLDAQIHCGCCQRCGMASRSVWRG